MFLFKKNINAITFSTFDTYLLNNLPPSHGRNNIPNWFKNEIPHSGEGTVSDNFSPLKSPTIKKCPAIIDYFTTGVVFPLWSDIEFFVDTSNKSMEWRYSNTYDDITLVNSHSESQYPALKDRYIHAKIVSPWIAISNKKTKWLVTKPTYSNPVFDQQGILFADGIVQFKNNFVLNINLFFPLDRPSYNVKFKAGDPIQKLIPLTEEHINIKVENCTKEQFMYSAMINRRISYSTSSLYRFFNKEN